MKKIHVKGTGTVDNKTILWEKHPEHPNGEIFVVNDGKTYEVAKTKGISNLLTQGRIEETEKAEKSDAAAKKTASKESPKGSTLPWDGYDAQSVEEVTVRLRDLDDAGRACVLEYEKANKKRTNIIEPITNWKP